MSDIKEKSEVDIFLTDTGQQPVPDHDNWVRAQIEDRLDRKKNGQIDYKSIDEVALEFGFHAR